MKVNTLNVKWPSGQDKARTQIRIGERAHAGRSGSSREDWVHCAHYAMTERAPLSVRRMFKCRGVKWHDLYRAAAAWAKALDLLP